jgi:hypothetical protein
MLRGAERCDVLLAHRDAMIASLQYGLATRNYEVWGLRWSSIDGHFAWVTEVISCGRLEHWGKTITFKETVSHAGTFSRLMTFQNGSSVCSRRAPRNAGKARPSSPASAARR